MPLIHNAMKAAGEQLFIVAFLWSPQSWMKTNGEMNNSGKLLTEYAAFWTDYYSKYIVAMEEERRFDLVRMWFEVLSMFFL
ncbi:hypothetical protein AADC60_16165 [Cytobacillus pseudoceanisediminis]|uniref:Glycosyl hydrolase family 30 TIM-barrel domain-containing protein n=1 Tax=Cytobacillus pseudoceanisediminis TaxID=3051614 RepID=A0ABZ2ZTX3_9BACI